MKRVSLFVAAFLFLIPLTRAQDTQKPVKKTKPSTATAKESDKEIHWITSFDELQEKMQKNPKKVIIDIYTDWCGWCKKMEATTYQNPDLIKYINLNYYAVRFNAERTDVIHFNGKDYSYQPQDKLNALAIELIGQKIGFPTTIFMMENFQNPNPIGGYLTVPQIEPIMTFFGDNAFKHQSWDTYQKTYKPTWDHGIAADNTPPPGH